MELIGLGNGTLVVLERISAIRNCGEYAQVLVDGVWIDSASPQSELIAAMRKALAHRGA